MEGLILKVQSRMFMMTILYFVHTIWTHFPHYTMIVRGKLGLFSTSCS